MIGRLLAQGAKYEASPQSFINKKRKDNISMQPHGDRIIQEVDPKKVQNDKDFAYLGTDFGEKGNWAGYIDAYKLAIEVLYEDYRNKPDYDTSIDAMITPLWYLLRHTVELCMKMIVLVLDKKVPNQHPIKTSWDMVKNNVIKICDEQGLSIDIIIIELRITEIQRFDLDATLMRFPITENREHSVSQVYKINVNNLYNKMMEFIIDLQRIYYTIDTRASKLPLDQLVKDIILETYYEIESPLQGLLDAPESFDDGSFTGFLNRITHNQAVTVVLLLYSGRDICDGQTYPSKKNHKRDDLIRIMQTHLDDRETRFNLVNVDRYVLIEGLQSKAAEIIIRYLKTAMSYFIIEA